MELADLGPPANLTATPRRLVLSGGGDSGMIRVRAHSAAGFAAEPEAADVRVEYDEHLVSVEPIASRRRETARVEDAATVDSRRVGPDTVAAGWRVTARAGFAATRVEFSVDGLVVSVVVTVGTRAERLAGADDDWRLRTARASGHLRTGLRPTDASAREAINEPGGRERIPHRTEPPPTATHQVLDRAEPPRPDGATRAELEYDFTRSTATRAVYADLAKPVPINGQPTSLSVWIDADGSGAWPSLDCRDADGTHVVLRGDHLTWRGPRRCSMPVPSAVTYPLTLHGLYLAETRPDHRYRGRIGFGDITAEVPPPADLPTTADLPFPVWYPPYDETATPRPAGPPRGDASEADPQRPLFTGSPPVHDADGPPPAVGPLFTNDVTDRAWRFAVLSDTQFVAADPDDARVTAARTMLRDIVATRPDLVLINGDFVDEGSPADLALARRILDDELADGPPWVYVPGNHEIAGGGIETFTTAFGPARRVFDHRGARFLTLDTSSLRIGDEQLARLRDELTRAAADDAVEAVVVAGHVPPHDPTGHQASRLADRAEAAALERTLADFAATGKGCAYVAGHAGGFASWLRDGVAYVVNGNSGKTPAAPPVRGGLLGWSECGVGPGRRARGRAELVRQAPDWLAVRVRWPSRRRVGTEASPGPVTEITPVRAIGE